MNSTLALLMAILAAGPARGHAPAPDDSHARTSPAGLPFRIVRDVARLVTPVPLMVLGAGGVGAAAAHPADARVVLALGTSHTADTVLDGGAIGGGAVQFGIAGAVYAIGLAAHNPGAAETGTALLEAQVVEGIVTQGLKYSVNRTRPDGGRHSFPSGHTALTFATADIVLRRFGWKAGAAAYAGAAYVGAARIAERRHYLSDVVFGAAVGIASARSVSVTARTRRLSVSPLATRHSVGFMVRKVW